MNPRPLSVTVVSLVYVATGVLGLAFHARDFQSQHAFQFDVLGIALVRFLAIVSGVFMMRGHNWARWLAIAWIAAHVILSIFHSWFQVGVHALLCAAIAYVLFRPRAAQYFMPIFDPVQR